MCVFKSLIHILLDTDPICMDWYLHPSFDPFCPSRSNPESNTSPWYSERKKAIAFSGVCEERFLASSLYTQMFGLPCKHCSPIFFTIIVSPLLILLLYLSVAIAMGTIKNVSTYSYSVDVHYFTSFSLQCTNLKVTFQNLTRSYNWLPSSGTSIQIVDKGIWPLLSSINWSGKNV